MQGKGIQVTIANNREYCEQQGLIIPVGKCGNTIEVIPCEFHLSSDRLGDILLMLGLDFSEYTGQCDGRIINRAIDSFILDCPEGTPVECPSMDDRSFYHYLFKLSIIANDAESREETVVWS